MILLTWAVFCYAWQSLICHFYFQLNPSCANSWFTTAEIADAKCTYFVWIGIPDLGSLSDLRSANIRLASRSNETSQNSLWIILKHVLLIIMCMKSLGSHLTNFSSIDKEVVWSLGVLMWARSCWWRRKGK